MYSEVSSFEGWVDRMSRNYDQRSITAIPALLVPYLKRAKGFVYDPVVVLHDVSEPIMIKSRMFPEPRDTEEFHKMMKTVPWELSYILDVVLSIGIDPMSGFENPKPVIDLKIRYGHA